MESQYVITQHTWRESQKSNQVLKLFSIFLTLFSFNISHAVLLTLDSIQRTKHDLPLDTVLPPHQQPNKETSSQLRICQPILVWTCTRSKASSERSATAAQTPESARAPQAHALARTAPRATSRPFPALIRLRAAAVAI